VPGLRLPPNVHTVTTSLHPAFSLRAGAPQYLPMIHTATARAARWAMSGTGPTRDFDIKVDPVIDDAVARLADCDVVSIDVETPKGNPTTITTVGVGYGERHAFVWPWRPEVQEFIADLLGDPARVKVGHNFAYDTKAFHAYGIDIAPPILDTIQAAALVWPPFAEVKERPWLRLALCVTRIADGVPYWKEPERPEARVLYRCLFPGAPDWQHPLLYCGLDCVYTWRLWKALRATLDAEGMLKLMGDTVAPAAPVLIRLEERGLPIDEPKRAILRTETELAITALKDQITAETNARHRQRVERIQLKLADLEARLGILLRTCPAPICPEHPDYCGMTRRAKCPECRRVWEAAAEQRARAKEQREILADGRALLKRLGDSFAAGSADSWRWLLFDSVTGLGLKPVGYTGKRKQPSVDNATIEALQRRHPEIDLLRWRVDVQHLQRRLSNVLGVEAVNGRVHFAYSLHRTETGRVASGADDAEADKYRASPGNAQNIPDRDRAIYRPSYPEYVFVQADWSQIEVRVMAWMADERRMLDAFAKGLDLHSINAAALFGCDPTVSRLHTVRFNGQVMAARDAAKRATHGWDYGMGPTKTARLYGLTVREANRLIGAYFDLWPGLRAFQGAIVDQVEVEGSLRNPFGRLLRFHNFKRDANGGGRRLLDREEALAFLPQSTVGDMCKEVLPALDSIGGLTTATLLNTTHDSFLFECHQDEAAWLIEQVRVIVERAWPELGSRKMVVNEEGGALWGYFRCPADFSVGRNWGKYHRHDPAKCLTPCPRLQNLEGLREWQGAGLPPMPVAA
jgi:DNA polymerase I-like protein with 3'-5' exonuclease and polymerase domains